MSWPRSYSLRIPFLGLFLIAALSLAAGGQTSDLPSAPGPPKVLERSNPLEPHEGEERVTHPFWDRTNLLLFSGVGIMRGMDYASTRNMQARGREEILLPDDVVNNSAGFAALEAAGTAASVGISYLMHRTGHHTLERWVSITHISVAGFGDVRNYCLKTKH